MKDINTAAISGHLTRDPELRRTQSGMAILNIGVASNYSKKNQQTGEWEEHPNFIDCTMFGNRAEGIANHLHKGTQVFVSGELRWSQWERDGQKRSKIAIIVDEIRYNNKQQDGQQGGYQQQGYAQPQQYGQPQVQQGYYAPPQPQQYGQPQVQQYGQPQAAPRPTPQPAQQQIQPDTSVYDDDIPF